MRITILLHSTTGNTRLVTRYTAHFLESKGHTVTIVNIKKVEPESVDPDGFDCLAVACPTLYFRPTFSMERFLARLNNVGGDPKPAFLLATCMGEPGAHFAIAAELLCHKGYVTVGAHFVYAPSNWPTHIHLLDRLNSTTLLGSLLSTYGPRRLRPLWGTIWPKCALPDETDKGDLEEFLVNIVREAQTDQLDNAPTPNELHQAYPMCNLSGRIFPQEQLDKNLNLRIEAWKCNYCGTCVAVCPSGTMTQEEKETMPLIGKGCTGCFACYNHCPEGAIGVLGVPPGTGRYKGPPKLMKELFSTHEKSNS